MAEAVKSKTKKKSKHKTRVSEETSSKKDSETFASGHAERVAVITSSETAFPDIISNEEPGPLISSIEEKGIETLNTEGTRGNTVTLEVPDPDGIDDKQVSSSISGTDDDKLFYSDAAASVLEKECLDEIVKSKPSDKSSLIEKTKFESGFADDELTHSVDSMLSTEKSPSLLSTHKKQEILTEEGIEVAATPNPRKPDNGEIEQTHAKKSFDEEDVHHKVEENHLYPELKMIQNELEQDQQIRLKPFTDEQLASLYYNYELHMNEKFIDNFLMVIVPSKDEFYEILLSYYRSRNNLTNTEHDVQVLRKDYKKYKELVWQMHQETEIVKGQCADEAKVTAEITYTKAYYSDRACDDVKRVLTEIRTLLHEQFSLYSYEAQLSRLQVESYIHKLYLENPVLCDIPYNSPVEAFLHRGKDVNQQVERFKASLTVLFFFLRKPSKDEVFIKDCQTWTKQLLATLLRVATLEDHLYIVNQLLRCPPGVGKWAAGCIQPVLPPITEADNMTLANPLLDHYITVLATILQPVRNREEILYQMTTSASISEDMADNPWILVDSDGGEDEDTEDTHFNLLENDIMSFLDQLPLSDLFRHIILFELDEKEQDMCIVSQLTENTLLRLFAFATSLIHLLYEGLQHFCQSRYRQLNKRLGKMILTITLFISGIWEKFNEEYPGLQTTIIGRLQLEYDMLVYRAVVAILSAPRLGSWQFLAELPYHDISVETLWRILLVMHEKCYHDDLASEAEPCQVSLLSVAECQNKLKEHAGSELFEQRLMNMPTCEAVYLLTTFSNMAKCRPQKDRLFIEAVTKDIYEIAYIKSHTRELCSKQGRDLIAAIISLHPYVLSVLLHITLTTVDQIGMVALYLFKDLPLQEWTPEVQDMNVLRNCLINNSLSSPKHLLARLIISKLNWGSDDKKRTLFLDISLHLYTAIMLVEIYNQHLTGLHVGNLVTEGIKQVASMVRYQETEEQQLANWTWQVAQSLHLHRTQCLHQYDDWSDVSDLHTDIVLQPIAVAAKCGLTLAIYLGLMVSKYSHSVADFCDTGVDMLASLVARSHFLPTLKVLHCVLPLFCDKEQYLLSNERFMQVIKTLLQADVSKRALFSGIFPGPVTKLLVGLIQSQMNKNENKKTVLTLWIRLILKVEHWNTDRDCLYVLDKVIEMIFQMPDQLQTAETLLSQAFHGLLTKDKHTSTWSSLSTLFGSSHSLPSLIETEHCGEFPWFAYIVLDIETSYEMDESHFWTDLQEYLLEHSDCSVDAAVQAVCSKLKLHMNRPVPRLPIYRWINQAVNMDVGHPLLPLVWQRFFTLYLGRLNTKPGLPQRGSIGERFFQTSGNVSLMKKMKKRLNDTIQYYQQKAVQAENEDGNVEDEARSLDNGSSRGSPQLEGQQLSLEFTKFYMTLLYWLDEPRLHDGTLYLPSLPPQYDSTRLLEVFQNSKTPWLEMIDFQPVDKELAELAKEWTVFISPDTESDNQRCFSNQKKTGNERILYGLTHSSAPREAPCLVVSEAAVPVIGDTLLLDKENLIFTLSADFSLLAEYSKVYCQRIANCTAVNCTFLELLPDLYTNETTETAVSATCKSTFNPTHKCSGAALIVCQFESAKRNDIIYRKIEENRAGYNQILIELQLPFPQNVCKAAVHVENAITSLVNHLKNKPDDKILQIGSALFYKLINFVSEDTKYYPPTCQFFSSCIEVLGQEFIRNNSKQSMPLLEAILKNPSIVGLLAPNFTPCASPDLFVEMYQEIVNVPLHQGPDVAVTLLTKFELETWLKGKPVLSVRENLLSVIGCALCRFGRIPDGNVSAVFQVYRIHLCRLLSYQFPDHFGSVLKFLLKASANKDLSADIWMDFIRLIGCPLVTADGTSIPSSAAPGLICHLSCDTMRETLEWMSSYFLGLRLASSELTNFGLYPRWKEYVPYLADFLSFLLKKNISDLATTAATRACDAESFIYDLWQMMMDVFAPWILPLENGNQLLSPWIQDDYESANKMVAAWIGAVEHLQIQFEGVMPIFGHHALNLLFPHYVSRVAKKSVPVSVVQVYNEHLLKLPWQSYMPSMQEAEHMLELCTSDDYHSRSMTLLSHVFCSTNWMKLIDYYTQHEVEEIIRHIHVCYFSLLVRLSQQSQDISNTPLMDFLKEIDHIDWNNVDALSFREVVNWFEVNADARCVLADEGSQAGIVLRLLKVVAGFVVVPNAAFSLETPHKRCSYIQCIVQLICKCSQLKDVSPESFSIPISNLITDAQLVLATVMDPTDNYQQAVSMCTEILSVLNHSNPQGLSIQILCDAILSWIRDSPSSPLLLPMLSAACSGLASIKHMVIVIETCIDIYFVSDVSHMEGAGWASVLAVLQVPELDKEKFIVEALTQGCYLLLYGYILQQLPLSQDINDELEAIGRLVFWTTKAKPSTTNEAKLILWWDKILELVPRQLLFGGNPTKVIEKLEKLVSALISLGEDKSHSGLLGAIGLGKKSELSLRFRLLSNALATFLSLQLLNETQLRQDAYAPIHMFQQSSSTSPTRKQHSSYYSQALWCTQHLNGMKNDKQYAMFKDQIEYSLSFSNDPAHCIKHAQEMLNTLREILFPCINYLAILQKSSPH